MPAPEKTTLDAIITAGRELIELGGLDALTMQAVAEHVGVRAPSLYKRVRDRRGLLDLVIGATLDDLAVRLAESSREPEPRSRIVVQANALRGFAHEHPVGFRLVFGASGEPRPEISSTCSSITPVLDAVTALVGEEHALDAARLVTAWANGFITMELGGALRMGGDVDRAWQWGLDRIVGALAAPEG